MQQNIAESARKVVSQPPKNLPEWSASKIGLLAGLLIIVCAVVVAAHWPALSARALSFDDNQYLTNNLLVQNPGWTSARRFLTEVLEPSTVKGYYQPLTMLSLMLDYALGGRPDNLQSFHRTSLALHVANTALVITLLYLLFGRAWVAAGVGLLFGLHPMTVEPIPWVSERKTLLAAFFALWCLILYVHYVRKSDWRLYAGCMAVYVLALMSKPTSIPLPVLMLLMDYWPLGRWKCRRRAVLEKLPFFAVAGTFAIITYVSQSHTAGVTLPGEYGLQRIPLILCHNIIFYLCKIVWPANMSPHYAFTKLPGLSDPMVLLGVIGTCILIPLLVISLRWTPAVLTGWLFFFMAILPTMGVVGFTHVIAADKFAYLPAVGLLMLLTSFLGWLCGTGSAGKSTIRTAVMVMAVLILAGAEAVATRRYLVHWRDTVGLYEHILTITPNAPSAHNNLGNVLQSQGKLDEAMGHYRHALQIKPHDADAHNNLGNALQVQGEIDEAIRHYRQALRGKPDHVDALSNLATALSALGKLDEAISYFRQALRIAPNSAKAHYTHYNLANVLKGQDKLDEAIKHYHQALRIKPDFAEAHYNLGSIMQAHSKLDEAISYYRQALRFKPDHAKAHSNLATALSAQGKLDEAITHFRQALRIAPDSATTHNNMGHALKSQRKLDEAISHYRQALQVDPNYAPAHNNLGNALKSQGKFDEAISHFRQALRIAPGSARTHNNLANVLITTGRVDEALKHFREAVRLKPDYLAPLNSMAKILATHPDPKLHDANQAIELAERAAKLTKYQNATILDTLAAAYAAAGQFDRAITTAQAALTLASAAQADELANHIRKRLELYRQAKP